MTVASAQTRAASEPELAPAPAPSARPAALRGAIVVLGLGAAVFLIARDGGFYGLAERDALAVLAGGRSRLMAALGLWPAARVRLGAVVAGGCWRPSPPDRALGAVGAGPRDRPDRGRPRAPVSGGVHIRRDGRARGDAGHAATGWPRHRGRRRARAREPAVPGLRRAPARPPSFSAPDEAPEPGRWTTGTASGSSSLSASRCCCGSRPRSSGDVAARARWPRCRRSPRRSSSPRRAARRRSPRSACASCSSSPTGACHAGGGRVRRRGGVGGRDRGRCRRATRSCDGPLRSSRRPTRAAAPRCSWRSSASAPSPCTCRRLVASRAGRTQLRRPGRRGRLLAGAIVGLVAPIPASADRSRCRPSGGALRIPQATTSSPTCSAAAARDGGSSGTARSTSSRSIPSGAGARHVRVVVGPHGSIRYFVRDAHSLWLETLGELGLVGLLLLAGFFVAALRRGRAGAAARARPGGASPPSRAPPWSLAFALARGHRLDVGAHRASPRSPCRGRRCSPAPPRFRRGRERRAAPAQRGGAPASRRARRPRPCRRRGVPAVGRTATAVEPAAAAPATRPTRKKPRRTPAGSRPGARSRRHGSRCSPRPRATFRPPAVDRRALSKNSEDWRSG